MISLLKDKNVSRKNTSNFLIFKENNLKKYLNY